MFGLTDETVIGLGIGLAPENAYPVPWPDFEMNARPALPPIHPNWEQERRNMILWFSYLWQWQGGDDEPDWDKIAHDINEGRFQYIEEKRLPTAFLPFTHPHTWGEAVTWSWSKHLRNTMDVWGRVLRSKSDSAMQFRLIDDVAEGEDVIVCDKFVDDIHPESQLAWPTPALLFEKRVRRAMQAPAPIGLERAAFLYDNAAALITEVEVHVGGIASLCDKLREYEASMPLE
ncbi:hypothetical protein FRC10_006275, partial [Ceratobasidium sp. 414]